MKNKTIEERAKAQADLCLSCIDCGEVEQGCMDCERRGRYLGYKRGATEQDRIARQEERERCIKAAQDIYCDSICIVHDICKDHGQCSNKNKFRKAMEGGEE